ncbi:MAG: Gfo/Idh/MocA family oxidoreductase [Planctomycetaceae bacterium]|nr:Gfo/Idh/MocA family oxidoreductase [Planctomycetaceae bacterium]
MPTDQLQLALVGCGVVARRHTECLKNDARRRWAVFCDPRREAAEAFRAEYGPQAAVETDFLRALDDHRLDGVLLCSPNALHYEQVCAALERGLHVMCEKPLAVRRDHIEDLTRRAHASGKIVSIAHQRRYKAAYATALRELTASADVYGPVRQVHVFTCEHWSHSIAGTWRNDPTQNLGYCGDAGIHQIDVVHYLTGRKAERLYAVGETRGTQVQVVTRILAEFAGGIGLAAHYVGDAHHYREDIHLHCERADLLLRTEQLLRAKQNQVEPIADMLPENNPASAFVDAVLAGKQTISPVEIALPIFAWNEAVKKSLTTDGWVDVD